MRNMYLYRSLNIADKALARLTVCCPLVVEEKVIKAEPLNNCSPQYRYRYRYRWYQYSCILD